jgi:elongation factor 3
MSTIVPLKASGPTSADVSALLSTILSAEKSQTSLDAAYALSDALIGSRVISANTGFRAFHTHSDIIQTLQKAASDKKDSGKREGAMFGLGALFERLPPADRVTEIVFMSPTEKSKGDLVSTALDCLADGKNAATRDAAQYALDALFQNLKAESLVTGLLPSLTRYLSKATGKWQGVVGAFALLSRMTDKTKPGGGGGFSEDEKSVLRDAMGKKLEGLIPIVEGGMHDLKPEVVKQAVKTMNSLTSLLQNDDVAPRVPLLISAMEKPSADTTQKAVLALSQTTFVAVVTSPVLALVTPLLERTLNDPRTTQEVLRQATVVVENLTKLVHDPIEARAFLPKLQPGISAVKQRAAMPELRELAGRALDVMEKAMAGEAGRPGVERTLPDDVLKVLDQKIKEQSKLVYFPGDAPVYEKVRQYIAEAVSELVNQRLFERIDDCIAPYIKSFLTNDTSAAIATAVREHYVQIDHAKNGAPVQLNENEVEIVNATFSLGYGGMLLLSHTNLRLLKGHRYGLCGRNGVGKSTLMRSISEGKLEGFPPQDEVRTCFVEHNQGEDAEISILEYCRKDPNLAAEPLERISQVLEEFGFSAGPEGRQFEKVGSLSGGWKMKLALARAMLMRADVYLLDEPSNHLDVANIKWLENFLQTHTEITSLIVSHDSSFLDNVCTDIYHYESKKLVCYPGNLSDFVKKRPEAKSYYTLTSSNVQFKFPPPGILTGVKSNTRAILRMTNSTYTYPGSSKPSLTDVSCHLSLSSRVAVLGPNGAGKSTLIKVLTGEVIPQIGKVEKHPNLRIGYIKQHALEHVEMHTEKTPNQYLQWRYANGDDREVFLKQTRQLTEEDIAQMNKPVDLNDGRGPRFVEALLGRQKWKKSFQYEIKWRNMLPKFNSQISRETLLEFGFQKLVQEFDDHESSREGLGYRILEPKVISQHFADCGLDPEIANHNHISGLSGGQKVKVVIAAAMWNNPHLLIMDEPSNFLDRDSLGGLAVAVRDYKGGVVMISHNEELVGAVCPEQWHVEAGRLTHRAHLGIAMDRFEDAASSGVPSPAPGTPSGMLTPNLLSGQGTPSLAGSAVNSDVEGDMKFRAKKKKKLTRAQLKEREVRRRLRHIEWLNSPKGTPHPPDTDDED